jgi:hypothetical protein
VGVARTDAVREGEKAFDPIGSPRSPSSCDARAALAMTRSLSGINFFCPTPAARRLTLDDPSPRPPSKGVTYTPLISKT